MKRREFLKKSTIGAASAAFISVDPLYAATDGVDLTVLHTNDMHSRVDPFPMDGGRYQGLGGMARRAQLIHQIRDEVDQVLLLDAGDIFQGTPYFNLFGGEVELKLMSQMGYDAATLGNHEFDNGLAGLEEQLPNADFPFVISNYDFSKTSLNHSFLPFKVFEKGQIKVGVFGLGIALEGLVAEPLYGNVTYLDPVSVAREMVQQLKMLDCQLIICLSHLGYSYQHDKISDRKLAEQVSGIDLIIGGHTHTFLDQPQPVEGPDGHSTVINQVGFAGINLGRIDYRQSDQSNGLTPASKTVKVTN